VTAEPQLRVLVMPDWSKTNPYLKRLTRALREQGVWVRRASPRRGPAPILRAWLRAGRPGILHLHWTEAFLGTEPSGPGRIARIRFLAELSILRRLGVRIVWTLHNLRAHERERDEVEVAVHRSLVLRSHRVIAHCRVAVDAALQLYQLGEDDRRRFHVIPHGSYLGSYRDSMSREEARADLGLPPDGRVFVFVGAIRQYKGVDELISAFRELAEPSARLVVAGKPRGDAATRVPEAASADSRITVIAGRIPKARMGILLRAADAVVLPFRDVLTSGSMILAMGFGRAVIAPRLGCLPETVPADGAILYHPAAPDALANALREALGRDLDAMGDRNLEAARALDWNDIARQTIEVYKASGRSAR
jgi:glycosyltransferase involved in cell wall biosynthesis